MVGGADATAGDPPGLGPAGLWQRVRSNMRGGDTPDTEAMRELANVPYLSGYESTEEVGGVLVYDPDRTAAGINLVVSGHAPHAALQNLKGDTLHEWSYALQDVWPGLQTIDARHETFWRRAHVYSNGDLLAVYDGIGTIKLNRDSELLWAYQGNTHHDMEVGPDGRIYTLAREPREDHERFRLKGPIEEDFIVVLSPAGEELQRLSVLECFLDSDYASWLALSARKGDLLHTNTIERMDGRFADRHAMFAEGNLLISAPTINTIAVIDPEARRVIWALGGMWKFQHQPTVLDSGDLLIFDNLGHDGGSKVIEFDPLTQVVHWGYRYSEDNGFFSHMLGSCQRLANGNTLITESTAGRAFEVTTSGEVVWDYANPHRAGPEADLIATLLEVVRLDLEGFDGAFAAVLDAAAPAGGPLDLSEVEALQQGANK